MADRSAEKIRKARASPAADFDEQLWPVNLAILVLAGFLVGIICAQGNFNSAETSFFENAYVHLGVVSLLVGTLAWAVTWLRGRMVRRVQFSILFSVLVHLGLAIYLHGQYLALVAREAPARMLGMIDQEERITVPDYPWHYPDQPRSPESFERPVETEAPEPSAVEPVERERTEQEAALERLAPKEPETPEPQQPEPAEIRRAELIPPEREQAAEQISRQTWDHRPEPDQRIDLPQIPPAATEPRPLELEPRAALAERQLVLPEVARRAAELVPRQPEPEAPAVARQTLPSQEQTPQLAPSPPEPLSLARANAGVDLPAATMIVENVTAPAVEGGAAPSTIELASAVAAVQRTDQLALRQANTAAVGAAEFALGSSQMVAQVGLPRAVGSSAPSVSLSDPVRRIARAPLGPSVPSTPSPEIAEIPAAAATFGGGAPQAAPPDAQAAPVGRGGGIGIPRPARTLVAGSGPSLLSPGTSGPVAAAQLARVIGRAGVSAAAAGGGVPMPARRFGRALAADVTIEVPQVAAGPPSGGVATGPLLDAQPSGQEQQAVGLPGSLLTRPQPGALEAIASTGLRLPTAVARRAVAGQEAPGRLGPSPANAATLAKASTGPKLPAAVAPLENLPIAGAGGVDAAQGGQPSTLQTGPSIAGVEGVTGGGPGPVPLAARPPVLSHTGRQAARGTAGEIVGPSRREEALSTAVAAAFRPGGLILPPSPALGRPNRPLLPESEGLLAANRPNLAKRTSIPAIDAYVRQPPVEAFQQRAPDRRSETAKQHGATEGSERAVEAGLDFLARHQFPDGHWSLDEMPQAGQPADAAASLGQMQADTAATGLALLAFLGAGYTHMDNKHQAVVQKGIAWLIGNERPDGELFSIGTDAERPARSYAHAIAAIALCEAYGMTGDSRLREPARRAIQYIIDTQHPTLGGWRYTQRDEETVWHKESDTSVSGWMLMALKSAQMAGLDVPPEVMAKVGRWLDVAQVEGGSRYRYNPYAGNSPEQRQGRVPNLAMTAEGLLMRMYLGWDHSHPAMIDGADYLKQNLPEVDTRRPSSRDVYYWYYATQVMFQMQDDHWAAWNGELRPLLVKSQVQEGPLAGSWDPNRPVPDRWAHAGGRLYVTTLNLLMLEVYYRYLPLFKTLVGDEVVGNP